MYCYDGASDCCQGNGVLCLIIGWVLSFRGLMGWWSGCFFNHGCGRWRIIGDGAGLLIMVIGVLLVESVLVVSCGDVCWIVSVRGYAGLYDCRQVGNKWDG